MHVIQAHRKRTGELRDLFGKLLGAERKLFDSRSRSWELQVRGDSHRAEDLDAIHETLDGIEMEIEYLSDKLRTFHEPPQELPTEEQLEAEEAALESANGGEDAAPVSAQG